jgi:hypothetical protein
VIGLPLHFCWTRFGTEASEGIEAIIERKEAERQANNGQFFWGIGNAIGPSVRELVRREPSAQVLFSPIKSKPRAFDTSPPVVVRWQVGVGLDGERWQFPDTVRITSGLDPTKPVRPHYALVCFSSEPLRLIAGGGEITVQSLRNLVSGNPIGASQVTAVVRRNSEPEAVEKAVFKYPVALQAQLVAPYFVELCEPAVVSNPTGANLDRIIRPTPAQISFPGMS